MKKHFLALTLAMALLFCAACGNEAYENEGTETTTTQTTAAQATTALTQETDPVRIPYWAEGMSPNEDGMYINAPVSYIINLSFDDVASLATDIVRVEVLGEERVELINIWHPGIPREAADTPREKTPTQTEITSASQGDDPMPDRESPAFAGDAYAPSAEKRSHERYDIFTVYRFRVLEVYRGTTRPGEEIDVMRQGGQLGKFSYVNDLWNRANIAFTAGDELVLFLGFGKGDRSRNPDIPSWVPNPEEALRYIQNMPCAFISASRSIYRVVPGGKIEGLSPRNDLTLTMAELIQIAKRNRTG